MLQRVELLFVKCSSVRSITVKIWIRNITCVGAPGCIPCELSMGCFVLSRNLIERVCHPATFLLVWFLYGVDGFW